MPFKYTTCASLHNDGGEAGGGGPGRLVKIHGTGGPQTVALESIAHTLKYDSGTREFRQLASRNLTPLTAAVTLVSRK